MAEASSMTGCSNPRSNSSSGATNSNNALRLSKEEREKVMAILTRSELKKWMQTRGQHPRPPKLHNSVMRVISAWFDLVDADGSGGLDSSELAAALKAAGLPCEPQAITEMIKLMDFNKDSEISWSEFEDFLTQEFADGKALLSGEYMLPSGTALPFGAMVSKMRRDRMLQDIIQGGEQRARWSHLADDEAQMHAELNLLNDAQHQQEEYRKATMVDRTSRPSHGRPPPGPSPGHLPGPSPRSSPGRTPPPLPGRQPRNHSTSGTASGGSSQRSSTCTPRTQQVSPGTCQGRQMSSGGGKQTSCDGRKETSREGSRLSGGVTCVSAAHPTLSPSSGSNRQTGGVSADGKQAAASHSPRGSVGGSSAGQSGDNKQTVSTGKQGPGQRKPFSLSEELQQLRKELPANGSMTAAAGRPAADAVAWTSNPAVRPLADAGQLGITRSDAGHGGVQDTAASKRPCTQEIRGMLNRAAVKAGQVMRTLSTLPPGMFTLPETQGIEPSSDSILDVLQVPMDNQQLQASYMAAGFLPSEAEQQAMFSHCSSGREETPDTDVPGLGFLMVGQTGSLKPTAVPHPTPPTFPTAIHSINPIPPTIPTPSLQSGSFTVADYAMPAMMPPSAARQSRDLSGPSFTGIASNASKKTGVAAHQPTAGLLTGLRGASISSSGGFVPAAVAGSSSVTAGMSLASSCQSNPALASAFITRSIASSLLQHGKASMQSRQKIRLQALRHSHSEIIVAPGPAGAATRGVVAQQASHSHDLSAHLLPPVVVPFSTQAGIQPTTMQGSQQVSVARSTVQSVAAVTPVSCDSPVKEQERRSQMHAGRSVTPGMPCSGAAAIQQQQIAAEAAVLRHSSNVTAASGHHTEDPHASTVSASASGHTGPGCSNRTAQSIDSATVQHADADCQSPTMAPVGNGCDNLTLIALHQLRQQCPHPHQQMNLQQQAPHMPTQQTQHGQCTQPRQHEKHGGLPHKQHAEPSFLHAVPPAPPSLLPALSGQHAAADKSAPLPVDRGSGCARNLWHQRPTQAWRSWCNHPWQTSGSTRAIHATTSSGERVVVHLPGVVRAGHIQNVARRSDSGKQLHVQNSQLHHPPEASAKGGSLLHADSTMSMAAGSLQSAAPLPVTAAATGAAAEGGGAVELGSLQGTSYGYGSLGAA